MVDIHTGAESWMDCELMDTDSAPANLKDNMRINIPFQGAISPPRKQAYMAYITGRCLTVRKEKQVMLFMQTHKAKLNTRKKQQFILLHEFIAL